MDYETVMTVVTKILRYLDDEFDGAPDANNSMTHNEIREMLADILREAAA